MLDLKSNINTNNSNSKSTQQLSKIQILTFFKWEKFQTQICHKQKHYLVLQ